MAWLILAFSGLLEVAWASLLPATKGFTRIIPSFAFVLSLAVSMLGLSFAARTIPIGTAYAVWVGIGVLGTAIVGVLVYQEVMTAARSGFLVLLVVALVGLRVTGSH